jgi:histidinol-phosphate aminotransferase
VPTDKILNLIEKEKKVRLIIFSNPNNPTGISTPISEVKKILEKAEEKDIAVLHDEAYFEFSEITAKDLIKKYDNLYIIRTFAKAFGLVSARAGYVISREENIQELLKIRGPYDVNMFAKTAIMAALEDTKYMEDYVGEVMKKSKPKLEAFLRGKEIFFYPSAANFLLLKITSPEKIIEGLKDKGILVRPKAALDSQKAVRVSIGTLEDIEEFIRVFKEVLTET